MASAVAALQRLSSLRPRLAIVLGSGFQAAVSRLVVAAEMPYGGIPGFPRLNVDGHAGKVLLGLMGRVPVLVLSGRAHYYEGHSMEAVTFPIRALAGFGVRDLVLTNAAGGINRKYLPGEFMLLADHLNFMPANPLREELAGGQTRFVDLTQAYDARLSRLLQQAAKRLKLRLHRGIYAAVPGPCYETPAEIRAFGRLGADAVGMSTVPEVIVARWCGLAVAGLSCITNLAAGRGSGPLSHAEVLEAGRRAGRTAADLLRGFVELYGLEKP